MTREALLLIHPTFGVLAAMAALWVLAEVVRPDPTGMWRVKTASLLVAVLLVATWLAGGLWDEFYFDPERDFVEKGSWAFFGNTGMEMKEHLFPIIMLLGLYLPVVAFRGNLATERGNRVIIGVASTLVVLSALAMEAAGAVLGLSVKVGLLQAGGSM
jgi:hypothetical protein